MTEHRIEPDILATITLFSTKDGGRKKPIQPGTFGCPLYFGEDGFDCRFIDVEQAIEPGRTAEVRIKFLSPELILPRVHEGDQFRLWEGGFFGEGKVIQVLQSDGGA